MNSLQIKAIIAGVFFGAWPLFMNRSGLNGYVSSAVFSIMVTIGVLPFALYLNGLSLPDANWAMTILAGICGALGLLFFSSMLAGASQSAVGNLFVMMTITQVIIAATYAVIVKGELPMDKAMGYATAALTVYLLLR